MRQLTLAPALFAAVAMILAATPVLAAETVPAPQSTGVVRLMAVGDVMLARSIGRRIVRGGPGKPWTRVLDYFDQADLVLANLECTISARGTPWPKDFNFRAPPQAADSLVSAGIDVVTLANNHSLDYGVTAFEDTLNALDARGIAHVGGGLDEAAAHAPLIIERNGLRIAILGYVLAFSPEAGMNMAQWAAGPGKPGLSVATPAVVSREVAAVRPLVDVVLVTVHGGTEYSQGPNKKMRDFTQAAIAAGAALVIGHHPHVLQGYRRTGDTLIAYSLGGFVFDYFTGRPNDTAILDVTLGPSGVESLNWIPIVIQGGFPRPAVGAEIPRIMARLKAI